MFKLNEKCIQPMVITWVQMTEKKYILNLKGILLIINIGAFYVHELFWKLQCNSIGNNPRLRLYVLCEIGSEADRVRVVFVHLIFIQY